MNIIKYNIESIFKSKFTKLLVLVFFLISLKSLSNFQLNHSEGIYTFMEGIVYNLSNTNIISWIIIPISLYYMTNVFFDEEFKNYITLRGKTKRNLFRQRVLSLLICNAILIFIFLICSFIVSLFMFRLSFEWTKLTLPKNINPKEIVGMKAAARDYCLRIFPTQKYYSTIVSVLVILTFLIFGLTLLSLIFGLISNVINNARIGAVIGFIYYMCSTRYIFIASKQFSFLKYFTIDSFILVNNHSFQKNDWLYSINQSLILLFVLLFAFYYLNILLIKKTDASKGE